MTAALFLAVFGMVTAEPSFVRNNPDGSQTLTGHVPMEVRNSTATLVSHASLNIDARIILPLANRPELDALLQDLYDPQSPAFRHFLTSEEFARRFTPSAADSARVQEFLRNEGAFVTGQSPNGAVLNVQAPEWVFEHAFGLHINNYRSSSGTMFFAPDADPTIPAAFAGRILAVGGLDSFPKYRPQLKRYPKALSGAASSGPYSFTLTPNEVKTAYNLNAIPANGAGQTLGLFELGGYLPADIAAYESQFGLPNVPLQNILIDEFSGMPDFSATGASFEVTADIEMMTAFAPGGNILVYEGNPSSSTDWMDTWSRIASDNIAKVVSCSYGGLEFFNAAIISFDHMIFSQMATQGQSVFAAAGDGGAYAAGDPILSVSLPGDDPYITDVGISILSANADGTYNSETATTIGGGGISLVWPIPSYQTAVAAQASEASLVSTAMRNVPDVVLSAFTPYALYVDGSWTGGAGSSLSSPIWASFISLVNQGLGPNGPIGFANPALYRIAQSSSYADDFHDITVGDNGYYPAEPGFDDATGLGSFNGLNLYDDLVNNPTATAPQVPAGLSARAGNTEVSLSWSASPGATSYNVRRTTADGMPYTIVAASIGSTSFNDSSVTNGVTYYYGVSAVNSTGESSYSLQVSAQPLPPGHPAPRP
jgi:subtilase family serine protease